MSCDEDFFDFIMNEVSDEAIVSLFEQMGIEIDLTKPWSEENA